jgi:general stress protein 26
MARPDEKQLDTLHELIQDIKIAMMTTSRPDGRLVSRPMATQERQPDADLWFVTDIESNKMDELEDDPHVNLAYYDGSKSEWVSVSGTARLSADRDRIRELWKPDWKIFFGKVDAVRDGGPDDPRMALVLVDADTVHYMKQDKPRPVVLFEMATALVTGRRLEMGEVKKVRMR